MSLVAVKSNFRCTYGTNLVDFPDKNTECMIILYIYIEIWKTSKITKMIKKLPWRKDLKHKRFDNSKEKAPMCPRWGEKSPQEPSSGEQLC